MTKVASNSEIKQPRIEREENNEVTLEEESRKMREQEIKRLKFQEDAIFYQETRNLPFYVGIYVLGGIIISSLLNSGLALIPRHDIFQNPEYFYEYVMASAGTQPITGIKHLVIARHALNVKNV